jgi:hypothetical protein
MPRLPPRARDLLRDHCRNKKVHPVALSDNTQPPDRLQASRQLNQRLFESAHQLWNVYIDDAGIEFNANDATIDALHVTHANQIATHRDLQRQHFDVIVITDLLEQLRDPGDFLDSIQRLMLPARTELIISAPSTLRSIPHRLFQSTRAHSRTTVMSLLRKHGLRVERTHVLRSPRPIRYLQRLTSLPARVASHAICRIVPYLGDGALVIATRPWP